MQPKHHGHLSFHVNTYHYCQTFLGHRKPHVSVSFVRLAELLTLACYSTPSSAALFTLLSDGQCFYVSSFDCYLSEYYNNMGSLWQKLRVTCDLMKVESPNQTHHDLTVILRWRSYLSNVGVLVLIFLNYYL